MKLLIVGMRHLFNALKYYCCERPRSLRVIRATGFKILSPTETIERILSTGCSVARFGDGEFMLSFNGSIYFQTASQGIQDEIKGVLSTQQPNLLVCIPYCLSIDGINQFVPVAERAWNRLALEFIPKIVKLMDNRQRGFVFGDANVTRPYIIFKHRVVHAESVFGNLKKVWQERDILIVEGEKSRLGVGNDLFANAKSLRRILCPAINAYDCIDEIERKVVSHANAKGALVLIALGPTATVLAARLARRGLQALDIGHVDVEYMWYRMRAKGKVPIPGKFVHEAKGGKDNIAECEDENYVKSIVDRVVLPVTDKLT